MLICALALFTSRWWGEGRGTRGEGVKRRPASLHIRYPVSGFPSRLSVSLLPATALLILAQLVLGATMRHQHAGLAIPDLPLAYGKLWPPMDPASVALYNQHRLETVFVNPITAFQIGLQMAHRIVALLILAGVSASAWSVRLRFGARSVLSRLALSWVGLVLTQVLLGAATIWSDKAADIATAHVVVGALSLALGAMLCLMGFTFQVSRFLSSAAPT